MNIEYSHSVETIVRDKNDVIILSKIEAQSCVCSEHDSFYFRVFVDGKDGINIIDTFNEVINHNDFNNKLRYTLGNIDETRKFKEGTYFNITFFTLLNGEYLGVNRIVRA